MPLPMTRRAACALGFAAIASSSSSLARPSRGRIEQWGMHEIALNGPRDGNPFLDVTLVAEFESAGRVYRVPGFYDGDGLYRIRFMPDRPGTWRYRTVSGAAVLDGKTGSFEVVAPATHNHGPVQVANTFHFAYADGTPYLPFGTTSYAWLQQSDAQCDLTLKAMADGPFNKLRMAVFPNEDVATLPQFPFPGSRDKGWDFDRFDPAFFQKLDRLVAGLGKIGVEADIILFHPYDHGKWGFDSMPAAVDDRYVRYIVARLSAFRNVWWSLANEYDVIKAKTDADFDRLFQVVQGADPYGHLRSIHHLRKIYNNAQPWVTHASLQNGAAVEDDARAELYRDVWRKPVVFDEVKYEGNIAKRWGNLSGETMVKRVWEGMIGGTYVGHGESIEDAGHHMFLAEGGMFKGSSPARIGFLRKLLEVDKVRLDPIDKWQDHHLGGVPGLYYLRYFGEQTPTAWPFVLPREGLADGMQFAVDLIDTWAMTITPVPGTFTIAKSGDYDFADNAGRTVPLPGKPWTALRIRRL